MGKLTEIRWHGRAGQGVVTAGELLAQTALDDGKYFQAFPDYGPERMGAPIRAFTRISDSPIYTYCAVVNPDAVVVTDATLLGVVDVTEGLKEDGVLVVNTKLSPQEVRRKLKYDQAKIFTVDATTIALEALGKNITNTPMIGALLRASSALIDKDAVEREIKKRLSGKFSSAVVEANLRAFQLGYDRAQQG